jgi:hypothetical protein
VQTQRSAFHWSVDTGFAWQSRADVQGGGDVAISRSSLQAQGQYQLTDQLQLNLQGSYERDEYRFSSVNRLGNEPWENINILAVQAFAGWQVNEHWTLLAGPIISFAAEDAASWNRAATFGGAAVAAYHFNDRLTLAGGQGVMTQIEDHVAFIPVVRLDWQACDQLSLRAGTFNLGAQGGAGVEANWQLCPTFALGAGVQYQDRRFRLDRHDIAPDGVGEQSGVPVYMKATWQPCAHMTVGGFAGVQFAGRLKLDDDRGHHITTRSYHPAAILGARLSILF